MVTHELICMYPEVVGARLHEVIATDSDVFLTAFGINAETEMGPWLHYTIFPSLMVTGETMVVVIQDLILKLMLP